MLKPTIFSQIHKEGKNMTTQEKEEQSAPKLELKLLVDQHSNRVLFAEAGKEVADFLLGLLRIPLGMVAHLLAGEQIPGSFISIYSSFQNLNDKYLISLDRDALLKPRLPSLSLPFLEPDPPAPVVPPPKKYFRFVEFVCACFYLPPFL
jgi:Protein of unknown function (DUF674)